MTAFSDYLESGLLHHVFRGQDFPKPANVAIALCSGVPRDSDTGVSQYANGGTLPEIPSGNSTGASTGYGRKRSWRSIRTGQFRMDIRLR